MALGEDEAVGTGGVGSGRVPAHHPVHQHRDEVGERQRGGGVPAPGRGGARIASLPSAIALAWTAFDRMSSAGSMGGTGAGMLMRRLLCGTCRGPPPPARCRIRCRGGSGRRARRRPRSPRGRAVGWSCGHPWFVGAPAGRADPSRRPRPGRAVIRLTAGAGRARLVGGCLRRARPPPRCAGRAQPQQETPAEIGAALVLERRVVVLRRDAVQRQARELRRQGALRPRRTTTGPPSCATRTARAGARRRR